LLTSASPWNSQLEGKVQYDKSRHRSKRYLSAQKWAQTRTEENSDLGPVSRKSRELFGPEKLFVKVRPAYSIKLVFSCVVRGMKIKIIAKFRASRRLRFEDTKRIMSPEIYPKSFGTFEKQAPGWKLNPRPSEQIILVKFSLS